MTWPRLLGRSSARRRVGRGIAHGKGGKTAGRGTKGLGARDTMRPGFRGRPAPLEPADPQVERFQEPFQGRVHRGQPGQLLNGWRGSGGEPRGFSARVGLVHKKGLVKVLGDGQLTRRLNVSAHRFFPHSAQAAIQAAGGSVQVIPPPFGHGRPPAKGNALMSR